MNNKIVMALASSIAFIIIFFVFFTPIYEVNDDVFRALFASGKYTGVTSPYLTVINILIGKLLVFLYNLLPLFNWYTILLYSIAFLALFGLYIIVFNQKRTKIVAIFLLLFIGLFSVRFLLFLSFTTISALAAASGILLFLSVIKNKQYPQKYLLILSYILLLFSCLVREFTFYMIVAASSPLLLAAWKFYPQVRKSMYIFLSILTVSALGAFYFGLQTYNANTEWQQFMQWGNAQAEHMERQLYNYHDNKNVYELAGWSKNDYLLYISWFYDDKQKFSTEKLNFIVNAIKYKNINTNIIINSFSSLLSIIAEISLYILYFILNTLIVWPSIKKEYKMYIVLSFIIIISIFIYYSYIGRLPQRVSIPLIFFAGLTSLLYTSNVPNKTNRSTIRQALMNYLQIITLCVFIALASIFIFMSNENKEKIKFFKQMMAKVPNNRLVFTLDSSLPVEWVYVFDNFNSFKNKTIVIGAWQQRSPHNNYILKKNRVNDMTEALLSNQNVYFLVRPYVQQLLKDHIEKLYKKHIDFEIVEDFKKYGYDSLLIKAKAY